MLHAWGIVSCVLRMGRAQREGSTQGMGKKVLLRGIPALMAARAEYPDDLQIKTLAFIFQGPHYEAAEHLRQYRHLAQYMKYHKNKILSVSIPYSEKLRSEFRRLFSLLVFTRKFSVSEAS
jgi:hypothetical protein